MKRRCDHKWRSEMRPGFGGDYREWWCTDKRVDVWVKQYKDVVELRYCFSPMSDDSQSDIGMSGHQDHSDVASAMFAGEAFIAFCNAGGRWQ